MSLLPSEAELFAAIDATWPAAAFHECGPFRLREGRGGGKRVSAATTNKAASVPEIAAAEDAMRALGQRPLFMLRPEQAELDEALAARGYALVDPVVIYTAEVATLGEKPAPITLFPVWPPLAIMRELWSDAGIGPERLAVMARASEPKAAFLARQKDRAAGIAFVACHGPVAMLHALEVVPTMRRNGAARNIMRGAAHWAAAQGAEWLALAVTRDNAPARALYAALGMVEMTGYHYRQAPEEEQP